MIMKTGSKRLLSKITAILLAVTSVFWFVSCAEQGSSEELGIYIPVLADAAWLTSDGAFLNGMEIAGEELRNRYKSRGFTLKTEIIDDKAQYEKGVEAASSVAEDNNVTAIFNLQNFDVSKTTAGILSESGKPVIFPYGAYDSIFAQGNKSVFCTVSSFSDLGKVMAKYAVKKGYKRIVVYHNGTQSQEELSTTFELALFDTGAKVVDYVPQISSENDFNSIYARWQALDADCVVIAQYGLERAFEVLKMIRSRDKKIAVLGEPIFNRANALAENKEIAEGMAIPSTLIIENSEELNTFKLKYMDKYGKEADIWAVQGYDMLSMVVDTAVRLGTNDPQKIALELHDSKGYQGIGRHIAFNDGGAMQTDIDRLPILICRDGSFR